MSGIRNKHRFQRPPSAWAAPPPPLVVFHFHALTAWLYCRPCSLRGGRPGGGVRVPDSPFDAYECDSDY